MFFILFLFLCENETKAINEKNIGYENINETFFFFFFFLVYMSN